MGAHRDGVKRRGGKSGMVLYSHIICMCIIMRRSEISVQLGERFWDHLIIMHIQNMHIQDMGPGYGWWCFCGCSRQAVWRGDVWV